MEFFAGFKLARCIISLKDGIIKEGEVIQFGADSTFNYVVRILTKIENSNKTYTEIGISIPETWFKKHFEVLE